MKLFVSALLALATLDPLVACPVCDTKTGEQVRAGIFNEAFAENVLLTLAPFPILLAILAVLHYGLPFQQGWSRRKSSTSITISSR